MIFSRGRSTGSMRPMMVGGESGVTGSAGWVGPWIINLCGKIFWKDAKALGQRDSATSYDALAYFIHFNDNKVPYPQYSFVAESRSLSPSDRELGGIRERLDRRVQNRG